MPNWRDPITSIAKSHTKTAIGESIGIDADVTVYPTGTSTHTTIGSRGEVTTGNGEDISLPGHLIGSFGATRHEQAGLLALAIGGEGYLVNTGGGDITLGYGMFSHIAEHSGGSNATQIAAFGGAINDVRAGSVIGVGIGSDFAMNSIVGEVTNVIGYNIADLDDTNAKTDSLVGLNFPAQTDILAANAAKYVVRSLDTEALITTACNVDSTDLSTGSIQTAGGMAIAKSLTVGGHLNTATVNTSTGSGALNIAGSICFLNTTGGGAMTIPDGIQGQRLTLIFLTDAGNATVTPDSVFGYSTITFANIGEAAELVFSSGVWLVTAVQGAIVA